MTDTPPRPEDSPARSSADKQSRAPATTSRANARSAARLAAVQALYQQQMQDVPLARLLDEFHQHRLGREIDEELYHEAETDFFDDLVSGVDARREQIDAAISSRLNEKWSLDRLDKTLVQVLRCGTYELIARKDVPAAAAINEYVDVAKAFFDEREASFVNGLLDAIARDFPR